ncbi:colicin V [Legionella geestiana]|uniref:Colicin V n=1 Tax=Legionella geestiana TaxID=45065 RepID=A0A0W0U929_9GAMM|nr:CvpA family protein [Legionella geestiana]KTD04189.1 colicin V [Legionella geestiana]QBS11613.1 CvpA family protein [Legionella geestiana]QDQ40777.1 CvpA family protein [Legionella geestiana]STX53707.1 colicin V [Legionella geestiana]
MQWEWVDVAILGVIGLSVLTGFFRGFVRELISLSVWGLALWLAYSQSTRLEPILASYIHDKTVLSMAAFFALLVGTLIVGGIVGGVIGFVIRKTGLGGTDRLLGMGFGFARGAFIVALMLLVVKMTAIPLGESAEKSLFYARFTPLVEWLHARMPAILDQVKELEAPYHLVDMPKLPQETVRALSENAAALADTAAKSGQ